MHPEFWHDRWRTAQIGFHRSSVDDNLIQHWRELSLPKAARVLVPLCGKSLDLLWLQDQGHVVVGIELSDIALQAFFMENGVAARRRAIPHFDLYEAVNLECYRGDLFELTTERLGKVAAVYDRASLVSWAPEQRGRYVEHLAALTGTGTRTLLVTLEYPEAEMKGPPFSVDSAEVQRLYSRHYSIHELARREVLGNEPRMRARGLSGLTEVCYRITRL
ncbi:MAG TPA: thiopurine S-methyltransferase [Steroidobacteraceae bacterium]|nr:thiopurine S-methyltransferase [Steroidobacteraceae bacterium]